jgi:hypothetical protein
MVARATGHDSLALLDLKISMTDHHHLQRFIDAQEVNYRTALAEITAGRKTSHGMWYVPPQYAGPGFSAPSRHYAIKESVGKDTHFHIMLSGSIKLYDKACVPPSVGPSSRMRLSRI